jgi:molecular chaperone GrpE
MALPDNEVKQGEDVVEQSTELEGSVESGDSDSGTDVQEEISVEDALVRALEDVDKFRDQALRSEAEMQNMQRRTSRDVENAHKFGLERFLQNLLPVVDSLEKATEASDQNGSGEDDAITQGVKLCHKLLLDVLAKESVELIDPQGEPFDPNEHQAMSMVENPDMEPNSVMAVVQKGYKLNGRLLRAAMVMVTKSPTQKESQ